jgi:hypothetical protein
LRIAGARLPYIADIFEVDSGKESIRLKAALKAALDRYRGLGFKRLRLTGLVREDETGGEALSRQRVTRMSELLSTKAGYKGEFILWVSGETGKRKGVRIEVVP